MSKSIKVILGSILILAVSFVSAQTYLLDESFTGTAFPPTNWTRYCFDGNYPWVRNTSTYLSSPASASCQGNTLGNNDWLITPRIGPIQTSDSLIFYYRSQTTDVEKLLIRVSTNINVSDTSQYNIIYTLNANNTTWQRKSLNLSSYAGNQVYIAFQYACERYIYIDDIKVKRSIVTYAITAAKSGDGTITPAGSVIINAGSDTTFTFTPNTGNHLDSLVVDDINHGDDSIQYKFTNVTSNHTIKVYFAINEYTITANAYGAGTIIPAGMVMVSYGADTSFTFNPDPGHHLDSLVVDDLNHGGDSVQYKFTSIRANHTIKVYFSINTYTLDVTVAGNGGVTKNPDQMAYDHGTVVQLTANPATGWHFMSWSGDLTGNTNPENITMDANKAVTAAFAIDTFTIISSAVGGGTIDPLGINYYIYGSNQTYTITPNKGYHTDSVIVDGINQGVWVSWNFTGISANYTITAYFSIDTFTITATAHGNGTVTPPGVTVVAYGGSQGYTITPDLHYHIDSVLVDGLNQGVLTSWDFTSVSVNHTIDGYFSIDTYTLNVTVVGNGGVTKDPDLLAYNYGTSVLLTAAPDLGWHFMSWSGDAAGSDNPLTVLMTSNKNITAAFEINTYTLNVTTAGNGEVVKNPDQPNYNYGTPVTLTAIADLGWHFVEWTGDISSSENPVVVTMDSDKNISATFAINTYDLNVTIIGNGAVTREPNLPEYEFGAQVTLTATPVTGWTFTGWSGDVVSTDNPVSITMDSDKNITATFVVNTYQLNVTTIGNGTVTKEPDLPVYEHGTNVTLTAIADSGWGFVRWSGDVSGSANPLVVTMTANMNVTATFEPSGWYQRGNVLQAGDVKIGKYVKDGGSMVAAEGSEDDEALYSFPGNKSWQFFKYNNGTWTKMESIPYGKKLTDPTKNNKKKIGKGAALCYDGANTIYAIKGNGTKEFWAYNINEDTWIAKAFVTPVPKALKSGSSIAYYDGKVYLLAGGQKKTDLNNFHVYDVATDVWTASAPLGLGPNTKVWKDGSCLTEMDGMIYALKGGDKYNPMYAFNGIAWTEVQSIPLMESLFGRYKKVLVKDGAAITSSGEALYAIKGGSANVFWKYTTGGAWTRLESIPRRSKKSVPKTGAALAYAGGKIYLLKGNNSPEFWQYTPSGVTVVKTDPGILATITKPRPSLSLYQNSPNPFISQTAISYSIPTTGRVSLLIYDISGRRVKTLVNQHQTPGVYSVSWNGTDDNGRTVAQGAYFYVLKTDGHEMQKKMLRVKKINQSLR